MAEGSACGGALPLFVSGVGHFVRMEMFPSIVPPIFPQREFLVILTGIFELAGATGLLLTRSIRAGRDGYRLRSGAGIHAAVLSAVTRRSDPESAGRALSLLVAERGGDARGRGADAGHVPVSRQAARKHVFRGRPAQNLRLPADAETGTGGSWCGG
jgi:hypothetical protein